MPRRVIKLPFALTSLLLLGGIPGASAAPPIAWEVRLLKAPWARGQVEQVELLLDAGSDPLDRRIAIKQGSFLATLTGLPLGRTEDAGGATVVFPIDKAFTVESKQGASSLSLDLDPQQDPVHRGSWTVDLSLKAAGSVLQQRTIPLHPHRSRLWLVPQASGVLAVLLEAWPADAPPRVVGPQDTVQVDLALVRGDWTRGVAPGTVLEADFPTWLDPFVLERGVPAAALLRPVSAGAADAGTLVFAHSLKVPLDELGAYVRGRRPGDGGGSGKDFLSATVSVREDGPGSSQLMTTISLQSSLLGGGELVMLRRFLVEDGATQAWIVPTDDFLHALFVRPSRGHRGLVQAVRPGS